VNSGAPEGYAVPVLVSRHIHKAEGFGGQFVIFVLAFLPHKIDSNDIARQKC